MTTHASITVSRETDATQGVVWVIRGYTKPHTQVLLNAGAQWDSRKVRWQYVGETLPLSIRDAIDGINRLDVLDVPPKPAPKPAPKPVEPPKPEPTAWERQLADQEAKARDAIAAGELNAIDEIVKAVEIGHQRPTGDALAIGDVVAPTLVYGDGREVSAAEEIALERANHWQPEPFTVDPILAARAAMEQVIAAIKARPPIDRKTVKEGDVFINLSDGGKPYQFVSWQNADGLTPSRMWVKPLVVIRGSRAATTMTWNAISYRAMTRDEVAWLTRMHRIAKRLIKASEKPAPKPSSALPAPKPAPTLATPKPTASPIRQQYDALKAQYPDHLLLFQLGDFFEAFDEDAETAARVLERVLTSRPMHGTKKERTPMTGFPVPALDVYLPKLLAAGLKVAVVEQIAAAAQNGVVERQVTRVETPVSEVKADPYDPTALEDVFTPGQQVLYRAWVRDAHQWITVEVVKASVKRVQIRLDAEWSKRLYGEDGQHVMYVDVKNLRVEQPLIQQLRYIGGDGFTAASFTMQKPQPPAPKPRYVVGEEVLTMPGNVPAVVRLELGDDRYEVYDGTGLNKVHADWMKKKPQSAPKDDSDETWWIDEADVVFRDDEPGDYHFTLLRGPFASEAEARAVLTTSKLTDALAGMVDVLHENPPTRATTIYPAYKLRDGSITPEVKRLECLTCGTGFTLLTSLPDKDECVSCEMKRQPASLFPEKKPLAEGDSVVVEGSPVVGTVIGVKEGKIGVRRPNPKHPGVNMTHWVKAERVKLADDATIDDDFESEEDADA